MLYKILTVICLVTLIISPLFGLQNDSVTASAAGSADSPWPMFGHDPQHTGRSPYNGPDMPIEKWRFPQISGNSSPGRSSPTIGTDGTIYFSSAGGQFNAINPDGSIKWIFATSTSRYSSPAIGADGTIYVGSGYLDKKLYAINPDGSQKWSFTTDGDFDSSPAIGTDGTIYIGSDLKLYAVNPDGSKKWSIATYSTIHSSPAISTNGTIYIASGNTIQAVNSDGSEKWRFTAAGLITSSPAIASTGTIYIGSGGSFGKNLHAINPDGSEKWSFVAADTVDSSPAIASDGTIYFGSTDHNIYAANPDGSKKWSFTTGYEVNSSPTIAADGTILVGSGDGKLYAINPDGSEKWSFYAGYRIDSSPVIGADGTLYVGTWDYFLYAIGEKPRPSLDTLKDSVIELRGLSPKGEVTTEFLTREDLRQQVAADSEEDTGDISSAREFLLFLGLIDEEDDLDQIANTVASEEILGYYKYKEKALYVISDTESMSINDELTFVHEYTHALQDQHFDLGSLTEKAEDDSEYSLALQSLIEGDATLLEGFYYWEILNENERAIIDLQSEGGGSDIPPAIEQTFAFPYEAGAEFAFALYQEGGWEAINQAYNDPPQSAEQIIHPEKYLKRDNPIKVALPDLASALGSDWEELDYDVFGELGMRLYLETFVDTTEASDAAEGWGGDRYSFLKNADGKKLLAVQSVWDSASDASEFFNTYIDFIEAKSGGAWDLLKTNEGLRWWQTEGSSVYLSKTGEEVLIILAPDGATAGRVLTELSESSTKSEAEKDSGGEKSGSGFLGCSCDSGKEETSPSVLLTGWTLVGLIWGSGYYLVRRKGRRRK